MNTPHDPRLDLLARLIADSPHNLVASGERAELRERHVAECLAVGLVLGRPGPVAGRWLDLGTGGGLPGLVLAMQYPDATWVLVDSVQKKVAAVRSFACELGLTNVEVRAERAERLAWEPGHRGAYAGVVARAVARLRVLVELARGFAEPGGVLAAVKGPAWGDELADARGAMERCAWVDPQGARVGSAPRATWLVTMRAAGPPPAGIPRRAGVPHRRPL